MSNEKKKDSTELLIGAGVIALFGIGIGVIASLFRSQPSGHAPAGTEEKKDVKSLRTPPKATSNTANLPQGVGVGLLSEQEKKDAALRAVKIADEKRYADLDYNHRIHQDELNDQNRRRY